MTTTENTFYTNMYNRVNDWWVSLGDYQYYFWAFLALSIIVLIIILISIRSNMSRDTELQKMIADQEQAMEERKKAIELYLNTFRNIVIAYFVVGLALAEYFSHVTVSKCRPTDLEKAWSKTMVSIEKAEATDGAFNHAYKAFLDAQNGSAASPLKIYDQNAVKDLDSNRNGVRKIEIPDGWLSGTDPHTKENLIRRQTYITVSEDFAGFGYLLAKLDYDLNPMDSSKNQESADAAKARHGDVTAFLKNFQNGDQFVPLEVSSDANPTVAAKALKTFLDAVTEAKFRLILVTLGLSTDQQDLVVASIVNGASESGNTNLLDKWFPATSAEVDAYTASHCGLYSEKAISQAKDLKIDLPDTVVVAHSYWGDWTPDNKVGAIVQDILVIIFSPPVLVHYIVSVLWEAIQTATREYPLDKGKTDDADSVKNVEQSANAK